MRSSTVMKGPLKKMAESREPVTLLLQADGLDEPGLKLFAKKISEQEISNLIAFANEKSDVKKAADAEYQAARLIIQAYAKFQNTQNLEGSGGEHAKFEARSKKDIDVWGVYMELRRREVYKQGNADLRKSLFNALFSLNREQANAILGEETVAAHTTVTEDKHAVLKIKK